MKLFSAPPDVLLSSRTRYNFPRSGDTRVLASSRITVRPRTLPYGNKNYLESVVNLPDSCETLRVMIMTLLAGLDSGWRMRVGSLVLSLSEPCFSQRLR